jgi:hypothetical protein
MCHATFPYAGYRALGTAETTTSSEGESGTIEREEPEPTIARSRTLRAMRWSTVALGALLATRSS